MSKSTWDESDETGIGCPAPDFALTDQNGATWRLSDHRGRVVTLLFYPGDETFVCTRQLCSLRDRWADYAATGSEIVGISPGTRETHERFAAQHSLPLTLLEDPDRAITKCFAAHWLLPVSLTRGLVVIDVEGIVRTRHIVPRAFRPSDKRILAAIRLARYDQLVGRPAF